MLPPVVPKRLTPFWLCESARPCGPLLTLRVNVRSPSQPTWRPVRCEAPGGIRKNILRASHPPAAFCPALAFATCSHLRRFHYSPDYMEAGGICQEVLANERPPPPAGTYYFSPPPANTSSPVIASTFTAAFNARRPSGPPAASANAAVWVPICSLRPI